MTPEEVAEAYADTLLVALGKVATTIPAPAFLQVCLALQEQLEALVGKEPTARPATRLVTKLAGFARLAHERIQEHQRAALAETQRQVDELIERNKKL